MSPQKSDQSLLLGNHEVQLNLLFAITVAFTCIIIEMHRQSYSLNPYLMDECNNRSVTTVKNITFLAAVAG